jgi:hypothetical protein
VEAIQVFIVVRQCSGLPVVAVEVVEAVRLVQPQVVPVEPVVVQLPLQVLHQVLPLVVVQEPQQPLVQVVPVDSMSVLLEPL